MEVLLVHRVLVEDFLLVVAFELYLIVWVPIQLKREDVLQKHVAKENLVTLVDTLRREVGGIGGKNMRASPQKFRGEGAKDAQPRRGEYRSAAGRASSVSVAI